MRPGRNQVQHRLPLTFTWVWPEIGVCRGAPPCYKTLVAGPLLQTIVAGLCRREGSPRFCYKPCRKKAARACYKPNGFEPLPQYVLVTVGVSKSVTKCYVHIVIYIHTHFSRIHGYVCTFILFYWFAICFSVDLPIS